MPAAEKAKLESLVQQAHANGQMIRFFDLPRLKNLDTPHEQDEGDLEEKLAMTLKQVMEEILENPAPDVGLIKKRTSPYTWEKVFARIESVYLSVQNSKFQ